MLNVSNRTLYNPQQTYSKTIKFSCFELENLSNSMNWRQTFQI